MIYWLKKISKPHPEFWKKYLSEFNTKSDKYVALSIETTGLDSKRDRILSLGAITIKNNTIIISENLEITLSSDEDYSDEAVAIESFVQFIGNATLIGHRIDFDIQVLNEALDRLDAGRLKNEALDIEVMYKKLEDISSHDFSIDELSKIFKVPVTERISSLDDAYTIALLFLKLKSKLGID